MPRQAFTPGALFHCADDQILIPDGRGLPLRKDVPQITLHLQLVRDEQITIAAETAGIIQRNQVVRVHMNQQRQLALSRPSLADRTTRDAKRVGIQDEVISGRQAPEANIASAAICLCDSQIVTLLACFLHILMIATGSSAPLAIIRLNEAQHSVIRKEFTRAFSHCRTGKDYFGRAGP